jgi:hypothetical protein
MRTSKSIIVIAILLLWAASTSEQEQNQSADVRNRLANGVTLSQVTIVNATTSIFHAARVPGGIATKSICAPLPTFDLTPTSNKLGDLLDAITTADPTYRWSIYNNVPNLTQFGSEETLLDVVIPNIKLEGEQTEDSVVNIILKSAEVQKALVSLQLKAGTREIGLRALERPGSPKLDDRQFDIHLHDVTVRTVLNAIARQHGTAVWRYVEARCNNSHEFSLSFLVW